MSPRIIAEQIKKAFFEGYNSYESPANAYNTKESAWEESLARDVAKQYDPTIT